MFACGMNRLMARVRVMLEGRKKKEKRTRQSGTSHQFPRTRTDIGEMLEDVPDKVFSALVILGSVIQTVDLDVPVQFEVLPESIARQAYVRGAYQEIQACKVFREMD